MLTVLVNASIRFLVRSSSPLTLLLRTSVCLLLLGPLVHNPVKGQQSPCPNVFSYWADSGTKQPFGYIRLQGLRGDQIIQLNVALSIAAAVPQKNAASIKLMKSTTQTVRDIKNNQPAHYRVNFPFKNIIPNVLSVSVNGYTICTGQKATGRTVTTINLQHRILPANTIQQQQYTAPQSSAYQSAYGAYAPTKPPRPQTTTPTSAYQSAYGAYAPTQPPRPRTAAPTSAYGSIYYYTTAKSPQTTPPTSAYQFRNGDYTTSETPRAQTVPSTPRYQVLSGVYATKKTERPQPIDDEDEYEDEDEQPSVNINTTPSKPQVSTTPRAPMSQPVEKAVDPPVQTERPSISSTTSEPQSQKVHTSRSKPVQPQPKPFADNSTSEKDSDSFDCGQPAEVFNRLSIKGMHAPKGQFPWAAPIFDTGVSSKPKYICGSTILTERHLVTAAHCMYNSNGIEQNTSDIIVVPGMHNIDNFFESDLQERGVKKFFIHDDYYFEQSMLVDSDIAVMLLDEPIEYNNVVRPICMWSESDNLEPIVGLKGFMSGWGVTENGNAKYPSYVTATVVDRRSCSRNLDRIIAGSSRMLCTDGHGSVPCTGDSGSGLVLKRGQKYFIRGIVSIGQFDPKTLSCARDKYVVYTDIAPYRYWLSRVLRSK